MEKKHQQICACRCYAAHLLAYDAFGLWPTTLLMWCECYAAHFCPDGGDRPGAQMCISHLLFLFSFVSSSVPRDFDGAPPPRRWDPRGQSWSGEAVCEGERDVRQVWRPPRNIAGFAPATCISLGYLCHPLAPSMRIVTNDGDFINFKVLHLVFSRCSYTDSEYVRKFT